MLIRCKVPFGYKVPGDTQIIPDGVVFDTFYFEEVVELPKDSIVANDLEETVPDMTPFSDESEKEE